MARSDADRARHVGVTLVEVMFSFGLVSLLFGIVFAIYTYGNKSSAKAAWRVQTSAKVREGLRVIKDMFERSSYPSVIQASDYFEGDRSQYWMVLGAGGTVGSPGSTGLTDRTYGSLGQVLQFYVCTPRRELETGSPVSGKAVRVSLELTSYPGPAGNKALVLRQADAQVTLGGGNVQVGGFSTPVDKQLIGDVDKVIVSTSTTTEKSVVQIAVSCRDPFDGRMTVTDTAKAQVNVEIH